VTWAFVMERVTGIEPASRAWEALILPLNYTRGTAEPNTGRPRSGAGEGGVRQSGDRGACSHAETSVDVARVTPCCCPTATCGPRSTPGA
jgi:hypothetical protein